MDITEAFRGEDISKTDFFDFVVAPDVGETPHALNFNRTLKSMGIFIENAANNGNHMSAFQDMKEANNNHLMMSSTPNHSSSPDGSILGGSFSDHAFWASSACDKEAVRLETAILEDLNSYCWSHDSDASGASSHKGPNNTDGAIYTLTVLNGNDHGATWYRPPETPAKAEQQQQQPLDLDSILSIIPAAGSQFQQASFQQQQQQAGSADQHHGAKAAATPFAAYDDAFGSGGKAGTSLHHLSESSAAIMDAGDSFNNNNDWKMNNNNGNGNVESLLRSALQGKGFLNRYNGVPKNGCLKSPPECHAELRRVLSTPPGAKTPTSASPGYDDCDKKPVVMFDDNHSSNSVDDLLLSHLDAASYPEDYEKLKRIANEVAESVNQYCGGGAATLEPSAYLPAAAHDPLGLLPGMHQLSPPPSANRTKKYSKKPSKLAQQPAPGGVGGGVRKERSLHYCNICSKGFKDKYSVNVHIRTHTGEKPFACTLCGKSFRQKAHLAKHYQTHIAQKNGGGGGNGGGGVPKGEGKARYSKPPSASS